MRWSRTLLTALLVPCGLACAAGAHGAMAVYRISDLDLRDPHVYVSFLGCRDFTDTPIGGSSWNGDLQTRIQTDTDGDGYLDQSWLLIFDPVDPAGAGGTVVFRTGRCTAPMAGTTCASDGTPARVLPYLNGTTGRCLEPVPGTVRPYAPAVMSTSAPCFASDGATLTLEVNGVPMTLRDARIAATYQGAPPGTLVNGLIVGFLTRADADATILPAWMGLVGGQPLSKLLPGGTDCCASHSDLDIGPGGASGWWFHYNFIADLVSFDATTGVAPETMVEHTTAYPNPFRPSLSIQFALAEPRDVRVSVLDPQGREVTELWSGPLPAGRHVARWDGHDAAGGRAPAGIYFVRVASAAGAVTTRVALLR